MYNIKNTHNIITNNDDHVNKGDEIMGLMDKIKKAKSDREDAVWSINKKRGSIILEDSFLKMAILPSKEEIIFYKDINKIERKHNFVEIKTNTAEFKVAPIKLRGAEDMAADLYVQILELMNENK